MKKKIETFKELFEKTKKLYPDINVVDYGIGFEIDIKTKKLRMLGINYHKSGEYYITFDGGLYLWYEKEFKCTDPQKIYNVIKAIKECEDD